MSFVPDSAQQISLFDKLAFLSIRKQKMIEKSWAQAFFYHIFTRFTNTSLSSCIVKRRIRVRTFRSVLLSVP